MAVNYKVTDNSVTKDLSDIFVPIKTTVRSTSIGPGANITIDMRNHVSDFTKTITIPRLAIDSNGLVTSVAKQTLKVRHGYYCRLDCDYDWGCCDGEGDDNGE